MWVIKSEKGYWDFRKRNCWSQSLVADCVTTIITVAEDERDFIIHDEDEELKVVEVELVEK